MDRSFILERLILAGGLPRSGTTLLSKLLNSHPQVVTAIDNTVYENWGLYYYHSRVGLIQQLRSREISPEEVQRHLLRHIVRDNYAWGIAPSAKIKSYPRVPPPTSPDATAIKRERAKPKRSFGQKAKLAPNWFVRRLFPTHRGLKRHRVPLELFRNDLYLCLKSPEIVFVLPQLAAALPKTKFVLVYRPVIEIAESMFRKGFEWPTPSYHRRWVQELDEDGKLAAPPGVPRDWHALWKTVSDFQRCVIYATSYLRAMVLGVSGIPSTRIFIYSHKKLCANPSAVLTQLSEFLGVGFSGFQKAIGTVRTPMPDITNALEAEYHKVELQISIHDWISQIISLDTVC